MNSTLHAYFQLTRLDKPIGTLLLLWPTLWGLWLTKSPTWHLLLVFILGVFIMRSAGCVINDFADRKFDGHVNRTRNRPLVNGKLNVKNALIVFAVLILIAILLLLTLPPLCWLIACFAFLTTLIYPFMKRFTHFPQVVLGVAFSWGIPMVYVAAIDALPLSCWLLFIANICWTVSYDTQYAMVDRKDDLKIGIKSTAILLGQYDKCIIGILQCITIILLIAVGVLNQLTMFFYFGLFMAAILFVYQQLLIKNREEKPCFKAFLNNNYVGAVIFMGIVIQFLQ